MQILVYQRIQGKRRWKREESLWNNDKPSFKSRKFCKISIDLQKSCNCLHIIWLPGLLQVRLTHFLVWQSCLEAKKTLARLMRFVQRKRRLLFFMFLYKHFFAFSSPNSCHHPPPQKKSTPLTLQKQIYILVLHGWSYVCDQCPQ